MAFVSMGLQLRTQAPAPPFPPLAPLTVPYHRPTRSRRSHVHPAPIACAAYSQKALIFDCDGVIVESEELHRLSYNECWAAEKLGFEWSPEFYEMLQNSIGGGKEKMRWYFDRHGWPAAADPDRDAFIAHLHERKTAMYKALINNGDAKARPGVLRLMDEAQRRGLKLAICSAASAGAVHLVLDRLVGAERLAHFDVVMAGDVVSKKKPDPMIYNVAREKLGVRADDCVVIEDSQIGLAAGLAAGMKVVITHTPYTASQTFDGATAVYSGLGDTDTDTGESFITVDSLFPELAGAPAAR